MWLQDRFCCTRRTRMASCSCVMTYRPQNICGCQAPSNCFWYAKWPVRLFENTKRFGLAALQSHVLVNQPHGGAICVGGSVRGGGGLAFPLRKRCSFTRYKQIIYIKPMSKFIFAECCMSTLALLKVTKASEKHSAMITVIPKAKL